MSFFVCENQGWRPLAQPLLLLHLHPESIIQIAKIISMSVLGATLPKPTETRPVNTK